MAEQGRLQGLKASPSCIREATTGTRSRWRGWGSCRSSCSPSWRRGGWRAGSSAPTSRLPRPHRSRSLPPFLAHAGIATTDLAVASMMPVVVVAGIRWLDEPRHTDRQPARWRLRRGGAAQVLRALPRSRLPHRDALPLGRDHRCPSAGPPQGTRLLHSDSRHPAGGVPRGLGGLRFSRRNARLDSARRAQARRFRSPGIARLPIVPAPEFWSGLIAVAWYNQISIPTYVLGDVGRAGRGTSSPSRSGSRRRWPSSSWPRSVPSYR